MKRLVFVLALAACSDSTPASNDQGAPDLAQSSTDFATLGDLASVDLASVDLAQTSGDALSGQAAACVASGGTVIMTLCCVTQGDFPNMCLTGSCGCAPGSSHLVSACRCPAGNCWDGTQCM